MLGAGGAGKTTIARELGERLRLPVIHLDALYWKPGWVEPDKDEWLMRLREVLQAEAWILDGNYSSTLPLRLAACDTVVFLDLPRLTCMARVLMRGLRHRGRTRPDMAPVCPERFSLVFLLWIWGYAQRSRSKVLALLEAQRGTRRIIHLRSTAEVRRFVADLQSV